MKRLFTLLAAALILFSTLVFTGAAAQSSDTLLDHFTPDELLQQWTAIRELLKTNGAYPFADLEKDDTGYEVTALQTRLAALGYYKKEIVDVFGNGSYDAMRAFTKANGLTVSGKASAQDQQVLYSTAAIAADGKTLQADTTQTEDTTYSMYTPEELAQMWEQIGATLRTVGMYPFVELQKGNIGYDVTILQTRLAALGYYQKEVVTEFGSGTYNALREFETQNGLHVDGVASAADQQALFADTAAAYTQPQKTTTTTNSKQQHRRHIRRNPVT